jgi:uncharacterized protein (DUF433 family)
MPGKPTVVHSDPNILGGTPVLAGTRLPVQSLFDYLRGPALLRALANLQPGMVRHVRAARAR